MTKAEMWTKHRQIIDQLIEVASKMSSLNESGYLGSGTKDRLEGEIRQLRLELDQLFTLALNHNKGCYSSWAGHD